MVLVLVDVQQNTDLMELLSFVNSRSLPYHTASEVEELCGCLTLPSREKKRIQPKKQQSVPAATVRLAPLKPKPVILEEVPMVAKSSPSADSEDLWHVAGSEVDSADSQTETEPDVVDMATVVGLQRRSKKRPGPRSCPDAAKRACTKCKHLVAATQPRFLMQHASAHLKLKSNRYACPLCGERFPSMVQTRSHVSQFHPEHGKGKIVDLITPEERRLIDAEVEECFPGGTISLMDVAYEKLPPPQPSDEKPEERPPPSVTPACLGGFEDTNPDDDDVFVIDE